MSAPYPETALAPEATSPLILALPKGRILGECGPFLARAGLVPAADYTDEDSRRLRFPTNDPMLDVVRVRPFDVATFVAYGAAQIGICGADVLMEFDYPEIYAPLDLGIGACRVSVAAPAHEEMDDPSRWSTVRVATKYPAPPLRRPRHPCGRGASERCDGTGPGPGPLPPDRGPGADRIHAEGQRIT
jgi:ATP phosphoribosyltransferase